MERATSLAAAFVDASVKAGGMKSKNWIARNAADKALHTKTGVVKEKDIHVSCSARTRTSIIINQQVDPWA